MEYLIYYVDVGNGKRSPKVHLGAPKPQTLGDTHIMWVDIMGFFLDTNLSKLLQRGRFEGGFSYENRNFFQTFSSGIEIIDIILTKTLPKKSFCQLYEDK